ncbi:MAG: hypothetical protein CSA62_14600 [Planctomycetota bacterium]|nr:MAG: hypothetical protein CSA62_14600 [Planctomycetota bacterium]
MSRWTRPLIALFVLLLGSAELAAQIAPPFVKETDPDRIEAEYKRCAPYSQLKWQRFDLPPFILFIEEQDRGSLLGLANQRALPLLAAAKTFREQFAEPLGLKKRKRPLPVWILKSRDSYTKIGGSKFSAAHFNLLHEHTVTYYDKQQNLRRAFHTLMHEVVHQVMFMYTDPSKSMHQNFMSTWYMEGMAEHFATREPGAMLQGKDPGFGALNEKTFDAVRHFLRKPFNWKRRSRMPFIHHPMAVMVYRTLPSYFRAVGITQEQKQDYSSQMSYFYRSSHSIVAFLDKAYRGAFKNRLLAITKLEYEGRRGAVTINQVFAKAERSDFKRLYDEFCLRPKLIADAELPKKWEHLRKMSAGGSGSSGASDGGAGAESEAEVEGGSGFFDEPGSSSSTELPKAKKLVPGGKLAAAMALTELRALAFAKAEKLLDDASGEAAEKLRSATEALKATMKDLKEYVDAHPGKVRIYLPKAGSTRRFLRWNIESYRELENVFQLKKGKEQRRIRPSEIPPVLFGEAAARIGLVKTAERQGAFGLLVSASLRGMDEKAKKSILKRAGRAGLQPDESLVSQLGAVLDVAAAIDSAKAEILTSARPESVLDKLVGLLSQHRGDPDVKALVAASKGELIERAFERSKDWLSAFRGKSKLLPGGRVRLSYDWTSKAQGLDWHLVDPRKEGLRFSREPETEAHKGRFEVETDKKSLVIYGAAYLRHRLQFDGDVSFKWKYRWGRRRTEQGDQPVPLNPGLLAIDVLRPRTFVYGNFMVTLGVAGGSRVFAKQYNKSKETIQEIVQGMGKGAFLELAHRGKQVEFRVDDKVIQSFPAKRIKARGAVMILVPESMIPKAPKSGGKEVPSAWVGDLIVEGKPAAVSLAAVRSRFYKRWLRRFPD